MAEEDPVLETWDIVVIAVHFFVVLLLGIWSAWKSNRGSPTGYFLAGGTMRWWLVGLSHYVTNIGSSSFIGLAGTAAVSGYAVISYEFHGLFSLVILGFIFMPVYIASGVFTMPEYMKKRFGGERLQIVMSIVSLVLVLLGSLSGEMYAGVLIVQQALGWNLYLAVCLLLAMTAVYTVAGGLTAVMYTDAMQSVIMLIGAFILAILAFIEIGGFENLRLEYMTGIPSTTQLSVNSSCGVPIEDTWHIFRGAETTDLPWPGVVFGIFFLSTWYFGTNQIQVQRSLAAKNWTHSKGGTVLAGYCKLLPMVLMIYPGMISRALWPDDVACIDRDICRDVCGNPAGCSDIAYPKLLLELMPTGLKGLMMAAMLAALMSSLTSIFNSASTIFTMDLWVKIRPLSTELELVIVGRLCTLILSVASVLWLPVIQAFGSGQLFIYIQSITSYFSPPITALYIAAIFWERTNEQGGFWGFVLGECIGGIRMILDFIFTAPSCGQEDTRPNMLKNFHFLHFACFLFGATLLFIIIISLLTPAIPRRKLIRLTYWTTHSKAPREPLSEEVTKKEEERQRQRLERAKKEEMERKEEDPTILRKTWNFLCGVGDTSEQSPTIYDENELEKMRMASLEEDPKWRAVVNINCLILMAFGFLAWGLFA